MSADDHRSAARLLNLKLPMESVFVKEVKNYGAAHLAGLKTGDRLLAVNGIPVAHTKYPHIVATIKQAPSPLVLQVVPQECDLLQTVSFFF